MSGAPPRPAGGGHPPAPGAARDDRAGPSDRTLERFTLAIIVLVWMLATVGATRGIPAVAYDTFRDMAYAENLRAGRWFVDPAVPGAPWRDPPLSPLLFATLARLSGRPLLDLYASSGYWWNVLIPVLLYLLVRTACRSRAAGVIALFMTGIGSYWWLTRAAAPTPGIQGVAPVLATLLAWRRAQRGGWAWAAATGAMIGATAWYRAPCGIVLLGAIGLHGLYARLRRGADDPPLDAATARRAGLACGIGLALSLPLLWHLATLPRSAGAPPPPFAPELHDPRYALHAHAPLVPLLGLIGLWRLVRSPRGTFWVAGYVVAGAAGELAGYLGHDLGLPIPWALPQEFQWHEQLALAIAATFGTLWIGERSAARTTSTRARHRWRTAMIVLIVGWALVPPLKQVNWLDESLIRIDPQWQGLLQTSRWIRDHVPIDTVIACDAGPGYFVNGLTGRKLVALPRWEMNPAARVDERLRDLETLLSTPNPREFAAVAERYQVGYLLVIHRVGSVEAARSFYRGWPILEPVALGDAGLLLYRVRGV